MADNNFLNQKIVEMGYGRAMVKTVTEKYLTIAHEQMIVLGLTVDTRAVPPTPRLIQSKKAPEDNK